MDRNTNESGARRILVTGATGFIGRNALAPLQQLGFEVHATARRVPESAGPGIRWHAADLFAPDAPRTLMETVRPTHLLHFGWYAEHGKFWDSPQNLDWLALTLSLLRGFAESGGKRFVGAGTCAEYDWAEAEKDGATAAAYRFDEDLTPLRPTTLYGAAKASAFLTGSAYARNTGLSFAWGRVFHLFGPGEAPARIVPALINAHVRGERLDCGPEAQTRDFLPSSAVGEAFAHLCASEAQGPVNIGSGRERTLGEVSAAIASVAGTQGDVRFGILPGSGPLRLVPQVRRLTAETGWKPPANPDAGLREMLPKILF